jgi:hypothetical protein
MFDGPTAAVVVSAVLTVGGSIIVAIIKLLPARTAETSRTSDNRLETRVAVLENALPYMGQSLQELRGEIHEMRKELRQIAANGCRGRGTRSEIDPAP